MKSAIPHSYQYHSYMTYNYEFCNHLKFKYAIVTNCPGHKKWQDILGKSN
ncbi:hypothetical protein A33Q_4683 [Indibacter alkaliphilus LW1]|uniref:Uncharacterized protein n=1 Tax=Indibacter alkaliphilus (strain CCUG 57479 / KCTC 22604 / LW1) TaxID=1189612 RepID=S2CXI2_INDAL|nr:hypothetical protein A33Q_4683 [Indibacter alkaliphilus LW1]